MSGYRSGFVTLVGRPNAGKSTLTNALVGESVAITSDRPQTTRRAIRGIVTTEEAQIVLVDTPGMHRPRNLLGQRLGDLVRDSLAETDLVLFTLPANQRIGPGDRFIAERVIPARTIAVATKADLVRPQRLAEHLLEIDALGEWLAIVPVSATTGDNMAELVKVIVSHLEEHPKMYLDGEATDEPLDVRIAELVRQAALGHAREELPHSVAVMVEEIVDRGEAPTLIRAELIVERRSQKAIVIGKQGSRLRDIGSSARQEIESLLGRRVYLDIHVRVAPDWQRDPKALRKLGF